MIPQIIHCISLSSRSLLTFVRNFPQSLASPEKEISFSSWLFTIRGSYHALFMTRGSYLALFTTRGRNQAIFTIRGSYLVLVKIHTGEVTNTLSSPQTIHIASAGFVC